MRFLALIALVCMITGLSAPRAECFPIAPLMQALVASTPEAAKPWRVEPGPEFVTEAERAITRDPIIGRESAVILLEETEQDDRGWKLRRHSLYHLRAKVLSEAGRRLAEIEIPLHGDEAYIQKFWGMTLLPDGSVLKLSQGDLQEQQLIRWGRFANLRVAKGVLPGVVPGAVIDYGYVLDSSPLWLFEAVHLAREWPTEEFRYRWRPSMEVVPWMPAAMTLVGAGAMDLTKGKESGAHVLHVRNLPVVVDEPWMPPEDEVRPTAFLYYTRPPTQHAEFWDAVAERSEDRLDRFMEPRRRTVRSALRRMGISREAPLDQNLRRVYGWIEENLQALDVGFPADPERKLKEVLQWIDEATAEEVLAKGRATEHQMDYLFLGLARALGAEAQLVLAPDRRDHSWHWQVLSSHQLDEAVVAVRRSGELAADSTFVDAGSGLAYGSIPWWVSGSRALLVSESGAEILSVPLPSASENRHEATVEIRPDPADGTAGIAWSSAGMGQDGVAEFAELRALSPPEQERKLKEYCGDSEAFRVTLATRPNGSAPEGGFHLRCEGEALTSMGVAGQGYAMTFAGPWIKPLPDLAAEMRRHPLSFPYPYVEETAIAIAAPPGHSPADPPGPIGLESEYGRYTLTFEVDERRYVVRRFLELARARLGSLSYPELRAFITEVKQADRTHLIFKTEEVTGE